MGTISRFISMLLKLKLVIFAVLARHIFQACLVTGVDIRDLKHVRRQRDDDSQNKLLQINYCEEELLCIIHCMYI
jgi:hypothetical protein